MKKFVLSLLGSLILISPTLSHAQLAQRDSNIIGTYLVGFGPCEIAATGLFYGFPCGVGVTFNGGFARAVVAYDTDGFHKVLFSRVRLFFNGKMFTTSGEGVIMPYKVPGSAIPNNPKNRDQDVYIGPVTVSEGVRDPDGVWQSAWDFAAGGDLDGDGIYDVGETVVVRPGNTDNNFDGQANAGEPGYVAGPSGNPPSASLLFTGRVPFGKTKFLERPNPVISGEVSYAANLDVTAYVTVVIGADGTTSLVTCNQKDAIPMEMKKMTSAIGGGFRTSPKVYR